MLQFFARRKHILKSRLSNACVSVTVPCEKKKANAIPVLRSLKVRGTASRGVPFFAARLENVSSCYTTKKKKKKKKKGRREETVKKKVVSSEQNTKQKIIINIMNMIKLFYCNNNKVSR